MGGILIYKHHTMSAFRIESLTISMMTDKLLTANKHDTRTLGKSLASSIKAIEMYFNTVKEE